MDQDMVMGIFGDGMLTAFKLAAPILIASVGVGLVIAIMQAATQIHEQTLTFVPKLIAIGIMLLVLGPWMSTQMNEFTIRLFTLIATRA